ncbi:avidin-like isoform X3 [Mauremys reevesii]|uniref:avidin-like isoform X3 n=1 Tax=Mauremys reevesii TaxID=260615 RepID=UPI0019401BEB|nr:avidin-like isoform X3 [Mauremys reevesii]
MSPASVTPHLPASATKEAGVLRLIPCTAPEQCVLSGLWRNELGSNMTISAVNAEGGFTGSYLTAVTATDKRILVSPLKGSQNRKSQRKQPTFGFTVSWTFSNSVTVFVGQCFMDDNGEEILKTMWLLRQEVRSPSADWKATRERLDKNQRLEAEAGQIPIRNKAQMFNPWSKGPRAVLGSPAPHGLQIKPGCFSGRCFSHSRVTGLRVGGSVAGLCCTDQTG